MKPKFKIREEVVCVKPDIMGKLVKGQSYLISKVRDRVDSYGHYYYGVDGSVLVYREDKFKAKGLL